MTLRACPHEAEVKALLNSGHWPHAVPAELRAHAAVCTACGNQVLITLAFRTDRSTVSNAVQLPPPGVLWWRAQLRRRNEAVDRIGRPILGAHIFAIAITLLVAGAVVLSQARQGLHWLTELAQAPTFHLKSLWPGATLESFMETGVSSNLSYLLPGLVLLALLSGLVVYLATEK